MRIMQLFDSRPEWQIRADKGMKKAAIKQPDLLEEAQNIAISIAYCSGTVSADDIRAEFDRRGTILPKMRSFMGSVFKCRFEPLEPIRSQRPESHGHWIMLWKLKDKIK